MNEQLMLPFEELIVHLWATNPPPKNTIVWASYFVEEGNRKWQLLKTCKTGCCVSSWYGSMVLPLIWCEATPKEQTEAQTEWDAVPQINLPDLYE